MKIDTVGEFCQAEEPAVELLGRLGWIHVPSDVLAGERFGEQDVLLKERLTMALLRINDWMTSDQAEQVIFDLENIDATGMARNRIVHEYLTYGMPLDKDGPGGQRTRIVRFFDFEHPTAGHNEFIVTTQFRVRRDATRGIRPDLVLFVNGIPLVVMEAKAPNLLWRQEAIHQLQRYQEARTKWRGAGAPRLFYYNLLCVGHSGAGAVFGTLGAPENAYVGWKSVLPYSEDEVRERLGEEPVGQAQLIVGLLAPATLLDILRDYLVFEPEGGRVVKKVPRYQQYRAVNRALDRILHGRRPKERGGVVWHTQGSGKSLTMLWLATKLRREPRLPQPTIVVVTDRRQLDRQITGTFERCGFPAPEQAKSGRHLRSILTAGAGRTIMTTIQKFEDAVAEPGTGRDELDASDQVVVMVDEAHRTQYGILGARLSRALPNAVLIGFTGTPIDKGFRHSTMQRFGSLIDSYTIPQSVEDGATVPILYEARLPDLSIEGPDKLDKLFDALFGHEPDEVQARIRRRYANKETVAEAERRIEMIALDIAEHFTEKVRPSGFKAQVVAPSRKAALRYAKHLRNFGLSAYPIIHISARDGAEFAEARGLDQSQIEGAFKDPAGDPEILVVVDMLLTGFDAPVEQVLYLDRSLKEHALLQAIARVNRRFSHVKDGVPTEKSYGLVVDYHGVSRHLEKALSSFEWPDVQDSMEELDGDPAPVIEAALTWAEAHFKGLDLDDHWQCVLVFAPDPTAEGEFKGDLFAGFDADYRHCSRLMDRFLPDPRALEYLDRFTRLTKIRSYVRAQYLQEDADADWTAIGAKVKNLIDQRIDAEVRLLMKPVSVLDRDFDEKIATLPHDQARASVMEHAIRAQISERLEENPVFFEKLSAQLAKIIEDLRRQVIDAAEAARRLAKLQHILMSEADIAAEYGFTAVSFGIYELLIDTSEESEPPEPALEEPFLYHFEPDEATKGAALSLESVLDHHRSVIDWQSNLEVRREMRRDIKRHLRRTGSYTEEHLEELAHRIVGVAGRKTGRGR